MQHEYFYRLFGFVLLVTSLFGVLTQNSDDPTVKITFLWSRVIVSYECAHCFLAHCFWAFMSWKLIAEDEITVSNFIYCIIIFIIGFSLHQATSVYILNRVYSIYNITKDPQWNDRVHTCSIRFWEECEGLYFTKEDKWCMFRSLESLKWLIAIGLCPSSLEFNILSFLKTRMPVVTIYCVKHLYGKRILICKINGSTMHSCVKGRPN